VRNASSLLDFAEVDFIGDEDDRSLDLHHQNEEEYEDGEYEEHYQDAAEAVRVQVLADLGGRGSCDQIWGGSSSS
jgi:hypothetical protein